MTRTCVVALVVCSLAVCKVAGADETPDQVESVLREADYDVAINFFLRRIEKNPQGSLNYVHLARRYMKKGREAGDESCYAKAESALREALRQAPNDETVQLELAGVLCTRHRFEDGLQIAEEQLKVSPGKQEALILKFDALLELGRYDEANQTFRALEATVKGVAPGLMARQAHLAELHGRAAEAIELMERATEEVLLPAGDRITPSVAWYPLRLGHLLMEHGRLDQAAQHLEFVAKSTPRFFLARAALAELRARQERWDEALAEYARTIELAPDPIFFMAVGDIHMRLGHAEPAAAAYARADEILAGEDASPSEIARELSLFYSERNLKSQKALEFAKIDLELRQDVLGHDMHAWALYRNGMYVEAAAASQKALQLGTRSAKFHYHAGMIDSQLGRRESAIMHLKTALEIDPHFDVLGVVEVAQTLSRLQAGQ